MRTLKKSLALVLALVMCFGIFAVSASAANINDFSDAADIDATYAEAVNVLTQLGIIAGMDDGSFKPEGILTREQGAKLIAYLMLGATAADALSASKAPFSDVPATRWSAGYIAYCSNEGLINGYGNGKFGPADQLTGLQFAKMLLSAVGYGANDEFVGDSWAINVAKTALKVGVFTGNTAGANSTPCTREAACLYAFNALTAVPQVTYSQLLGEYTTGGALNTQTGTTLGEDLYDLYKTDFNGSDVSSVAYTGKYYNTISSRLFNYKNEQVVTIPQTTIYYDLTTKDIGREGYLWVVADKTAIGGYRAVSNLVYTDNVLKEVTTAADAFGDATPFANWSKASSMFYVAPVEVADNGNIDVDIYVNGKITTSRTEIVSGTNSVLIDSNNNGAFDKVITIAKSVGDVEDDIRTSGATVNIPGVTNRYVKAVGYEGVAVGDVVSYYEDVDGTYVIDELDPIKGQLTAQGKMLGILDTYTFAGGFYMAANQIHGYSFDVDQNVDAEIFLLNGSIVFGRNVSDTSIDDVVFVLGLDEDGFATIGDNTYYAQLLFQDGTRKIVETDEDYRTFYAAGSLANEYATYSTNSKGQYLLEKVALPTGVMVDSAAVAVTGGRAAFAPGFIGTDDTKFVIKNGTVWTTFTGIANLGDSVTTVNVYALNDKYGYAKFVYIDGNMTGVDDVVYIVDGGSYTTYAKTATADAHRVYSAIVDGQLTTVKSTTNPTIPVANGPYGPAPVSITGLCKVTYNSAGLINSFTPLAQGTDAGFAAGTGVFKAVGGTIKLEGNGVYTYSASTKVFVYENMAMREGTITEFLNDNTDQYQLKLKTGSTSAIDTIYLRKVNNTSNTLSKIAITTGNVTTNVAVTINAGVGAGTAASPYRATADAGVLTAGAKTVSAAEISSVFCPPATGFTSSAATVTFAAGIENNKTVDVTIAVTSESGATAYYTVTITYDIIA